MKKLTTFVAVVALTLTLAACKKKRDTEAKDDIPRPTAEEAKPAPSIKSPADDKAPKPDEAKPATGGVPAECTAYKELVDKLATCTKLPPTARDALKGTYDTAAKAWATPPTDEAAKKTIADTCRTNTEAIRQAAP